MPYDINLVKQGVYKIPVKVKTTDANYKFFTNVLFGQPSVASNNDYIMMDYANRGVKLTEEAIKGADPTRVNYGNAFNEKAIFGLYFNDTDQVSVAQADNRVSMDEPIDNPWDTDTRLSYLLSDKRDGIVTSHDATFEKVLAETVLTGQFTAKNEGVQSFPITASLLGVSGANMTTKPLETLASGAKLLLKKTGARPTMLVMNPEDAIKLVQSSALKDLLDNRRVIGNEVHFKAITDNGAAYNGTVMVPGIGSVEIISYYGGYTDNAGNFHYYIPEGKAIFCPDTVGCKGYCGVFVDNGMFTGKTALEHGVYIWDEQKALPHSTHVQVQSAPTPILTAIDRYCVFTNIA